MDILLILGIAIALTLGWAVSFLGLMIVVIAISGFTDADRNEID
jgi:hypothetical protein